MKRIMLVLAVAAVMLIALAAPAMAKDRDDRNGFGNGFDRVGCCNNFFGGGGNFFGNDRDDFFFNRDFDDFSSFNFVQPCGWVWWPGWGWWLSC